MAKVETRCLPENGKLNSVSETIRALRGAMADELSAQNLYLEIIDYLRQGAGTEYLIGKLTEIMEDEMQHAGILLDCINMLDNNIGVQMEKGARGTE